MSVTLQCPECGETLFGDVPIAVVLCKDCMGKKVDSIKLEECDICGQGCEPERMTTTNNDQRMCDLCREDLDEEDR